MNKQIIFSILFALVAILSVLTSAMRHPARAPDFTYSTQGVAKV